MRPNESSGSGNDDWLVTAVFERLGLFGGMFDRVFRRMIRHRARSAEQPLSRRAKRHVLLPALGGKPGRSANDDSINQQKDPYRQKNVSPAGGVERERPNRPPNEHHNGNNESKIHAWRE